MVADDEALIDVETVLTMITDAPALEGDNLRFVLDALASATDSALDFLSGRIECHTAQGGVLEAQLAALRAQARNREEKAAVALVAARAAEGSGDSATARDLINEALTVRPGLEPALHDGAQYAAARGDYATADRYLRRAEQPSPLRPGLSEAIAATDHASDLGRNSPCPCGSGRKFKACCLRDALPPLHARAQLIYALLGTYAERAPGLEVIMPLIERTGNPAQYAMFLLDLALFPGGLVDKFLAARGHWLHPDERELIEDWRRVPVTLYEAVEVQRDAGVTLRALPDGEPIQVADTLFSQSVQRLDLLCGRVLHDRSAPRMLAATVPIPRQRRRELADLLASDPPPEKIADFLAPEPPVQLRNSDGDDVYDCRVVYRVPDPQHGFDQLTDRLTRAGEDVLAWHRHQLDGRVLNLGVIERAGAQFTVIANSPARLAHLEALLLEVAPDALEQQRHAERLSPDPGDREARTLILDSYFLDGTAAEQGEAADQLSRDAEASWLDTEGIIGDLSPRQAAASSNTAVRAELRSTIDDIESILLQTQRAGQPTAGLMSPHQLRETLGLEKHTR
ncbi:MAG: SEC-C domain-containing protein [Pseudonocardiales bacterium]|nr:SEC-C domain-containing protein [Pseudonocardiales bacterium]MBV9651125.1 SEC-C domain-containing protein [Pseudonocardiales bacterium]